MNLRKYNTKKCPRCGEKCHISQAKCEECGLVFSKLLNVTNKAGKKALVKRQRDKVLMVSAWPADAVRWKALLLCGFLGLFGGHNFYLGRYIKATFSLVLSLLTVYFASLTVYPAYYETFMAIFAIPGAFPLLFWIMDFVYIATGKYKIPVAINEKLASGK